jgi:hypothetical protein
MSLGFGKTQSQLKYVTLVQKENMGVEIKNHYQNNLGKQRCFLVGKKIRVSILPNLMSRCGEGFETAILDTL